MAAPDFDTGSPWVTLKFFPENFIKSSAIDFCFAVRSMVFVRVALFVCNLILMVENVFAISSTLPMLKVKAWVMETFQQLKIIFQVLQMMR